MPRSTGHASPVEALRAEFDRLSGEQDGLDYIVMECVPGKSLAVKFRSGAIGLREATASAFQVIERCWTGRTVCSLVFRNPS
jgi:hypothetical protein